MTHYPRKVSNETAAQAARRAILLGMKPGIEYTAGDLARFTGTSEKATSFQAGNLVKMGWVVKAPPAKSIEIYALAPKKPQ